MCESCWDELMRDHGIQPEGSEPRPEHLDPHPVARAIGRVFAALIVLATGGCLLGIVVRVFQWVWPG